MCLCLCECVHSPWRDVLLLENRLLLLMTLSKTDGIYCKNKKNEWRERERVCAPVYACSITNQDKCDTKQCVGNVLYISRHQKYYFLIWRHNTCTIHVFVKQSCYVVQNRIEPRYMKSLNIFKNKEVSKWHFISGKFISGTYNLLSFLLLSSWLENGVRTLKRIVLVNNTAHSKNI